MDESKSNGQRNIPGISFIAAGVSCVCAAVCTNPIDVVKIRMQLDQELTKSMSKQKPKYRGTFHGLYLVPKEEGIKGIFRGVTASMMREASYSTLRIGLYPFFKNIYLKQESVQTGYGKGKDPLLIKLAAGMSSGIIGAAIFNPFDLIKVRFQAATGPAPYRSVPHAVVSIMKKEGFAGLYTGVGPNTLRAGLLTAVQVGTYDQMKQFFLSFDQFEDDSILHIISSFAAGFWTSLATATVDQMKTRMMNDRMSGNSKYKNSFDCLKQTFRAEGVHGLFKGFTAQWIRIGPHTMISFIVAEQILKYFQYNKI